jgi:hypothetical protein
MTIAPKVILKMVVFAPIPGAKVNMATVVKPGLRAKLRNHSVYLAGERP